MTESALPPDDAAAVASARASEQARLRKERREAKIKAGGSARLNKITGLNGGFQRDPIPDFSKPADSDPSPSPAKHTPTPSQSAADDTDDPAEVDISNTPPVSSDTAQLRQLMQSLNASTPPPSTNPFLNPSAGAGAGPNAPGGADDPMMQIFNQLLGGQPGASPFPGGGAFPNMPTPPTAHRSPVDTYAAVWRILHLIVAVSLGLYIALFSNFLGTKESRDAAALRIPTASDEDGSYMYDDDQRRHLFFYAFATAEAVLLTSRFFLDRSRDPPSGMLWTVAGFLPGGLKSPLETGLRYWQIFSTVRSDLLVCVFILGVTHWIRAT